MNYKSGSKELTSEIKKTELLTQLFSNKTKLFSKLQELENKDMFISIANKNPRELESFEYVALENAYVLKLNELDEKINDTLLIDGKNIQTQSVTEKTEKEKVKVKVESMDNFTAEADASKSAYNKGYTVEEELKPDLEFDSAFDLEDDYEEEEENDEEFDSEEASDDDLPFN